LSVERTTFAVMGARTSQRTDAARIAIRIVLATDTARETRRAVLSRRTLIVARDTSAAFSADRVAKRFRIGAIGVAAAGRARIGGLSGATAAASGLSAARSAAGRRGAAGRHGRILAGILSTDRSISGAAGTSIDEFEVGNSARGEEAERADCRDSSHA
jgi:hypothetical protein